MMNPLANAGDTGSIPDPKRIPHASAKLSPHATTIEPVPRAQEPQPLSPHAQSLCSAAREATAVRTPGTVTRG